MSAPLATPREIPFNYTSADDRQAVGLLLGPEVWDRLEALRARRGTGRSARLLMRFCGEIGVHRRNPSLFQELVDAPARRRRLFDNLEKDLAIIERNAGGEPLVLEVLAASRALLDAFRREVEGTPDLRRRMARDLGAIVGRDAVLHRGGAEHLRVAEAGQAGALGVLRDAGLEGDGAEVEGGASVAHGGGT